MLTPSQVAAPREVNTGTRARCRTCAWFRGHLDRAGAGKCVVGPVWVDVLYGHYCAQYVTAAEWRDGG